MTSVTAQRADDVARRVHGTPARAPGPVYVGLITRAVAFVIDAALLNAVAAIVAAATALVVSVFPIGHNAKTVLVAIGGVAFFLWLAGYFTVFWSTTGQTPGNRVMQIRVLDARAGTVKPSRAIVRVVGLALAIFPLFAGFIPILFNERRRGLADWMANTVVVQARPAVAQSLNGHRPLGAR
jgi:uncharacterized RDD family membrane protein YckC